MAILNFYPTHTQAP